MLDFNWTLVLQFVNFAVLLFFLNRILYRPVRKVLTERNTAIDGSYARARELQGAIDEKMKRYQQQLSQAKKVANEERAALKKAAIEEEMKMLATAQQNAALRMQQIKERVAQESVAAGALLKQESEVIARQIATKILGRPLI